MFHLILTQTQNLEVSPSESFMIHKNNIIKCSETLNRHCLTRKTIHTHRFQYALSHLLGWMSSSRSVESSHRNRYIDPKRIVCLEFHPLLKPYHWAKVYPPEAVEIWLVAIMQNNGIFHWLLKWPQWSFHPRRNITRFLLNPFQRSGEYPSVVLSHPSLNM